MRDTSKQIRDAVYACLNGNLGGVPVYDEKRLVSSTATSYVLLSTQQETPTEENDCTWITKSSIDIEVVQRTGSEVSKNTIDELSNSILTLLVPTRGTSGLTEPSLLQFANPYCESIISRNVSLSETESVLVKVIRFVVTVIQQS